MSSVSFEGEKNEGEEKKKGKTKWVPYSWESFNALFDVFFFFTSFYFKFTPTLVDALFFSIFHSPSLYPVLIINSFRLRVIYVEIDSSIVFFFFFGLRRI